MLVLDGIKGAKGDTGKNGEDGRDGAPGLDGLPGLSGQSMSMVNIPNLLFTDLLADICSDLLMEPCYKYTCTCIYTSAVSIFVEIF